MSLKEDLSFFLTLSRDIIISSHSDMVTAANKEMSSAPTWKLFFFLYFGLILMTMNKNSRYNDDKYRNLILFDVLFKDYFLTFALEIQVCYLSLLFNYEMRRKLMQMRLFHLIKSFRFVKHIISYGYSWSSWFTIILQYCNIFPKNKT